MRHAARALSIGQVEVAAMRFPPSLPSALGAGLPSRRRPRRQDVNTTPATPACPARQQRVGTEPGADPPACWPDVRLPFSSKTSSELFMCGFWLG